ncbi:sulfur carrier protein ThiS [Bacterioplanoides pacificum]|uniref:Sulfur carrier protein ThiS n=1 Tax=Bacterioplanoides pacificum TaxID=1171596 RepID=A0ABV7VVH1_9GAMM
MNLAINGEQQRFDVIQTLQQLLMTLGYVSAAGVVQGNIVVALNQTIIPVSQYAETQLNDNDQLDILGAITGG